MPSQQAGQMPVRLIVADPSENKAHQLDSFLRDAGVQTRLKHLAQLADVKQQLEETGADLLLCAATYPQLDQLLPIWRAERPDLSVLLLTDDTQRLPTGMGLEMGASDVVAEADRHHLLMAVKRELAHISQRHRLHTTSRALAEAEQRCQLLLASSTAAIAYVHEGMHIYANDGYIELFGFADAEEMIGLPLIDLLEAGCGDALKAELKRIRAGEAAAGIEFSGTTTAGGTVTGRMTLSPAEYEGERCLQVTVRPNRPPAPAAPPPVPAAPTAEPLNLKGLCDQIDAMRQGQGGRDPAMIAFRIDGFIPLQKRHGIDAANKVAALVFDVARACLADHPYWQVDTHNIITASLADSPAQTLAIAESIRQAVSDLAVELDDRTVHATVTVAIEPVDDSVSLSTHADRVFARLLDTRDAGNTVLAPLDPAATMAQGSAPDKVLEIINEAIDKQSFLLLFQPIISLRGDADEHYEVFLRMLDANGKEFAPDDFLQSAIDHGVAGKIDRWVILQSIKMLSMHRSKGHNTRLTINITINSIEDDEFIQWLSVAIKAARLPIDAVIFQITEENATRNIDRTRAFVEGLTGMHCQASLSRFGLIDKPFDTLRHLAVDYVKLDGRHIQALDSDDPDAKDRLRSLVRTLQGKGKLTIIPMVESANALSTIWQAGANYIQGEYLQAPATEMDYDFSTEDDD